MIPSSPREEWISIFNVSCDRLLADECLWLTADVQHVTTYMAFLRFLHSNVEGNPQVLACIQTLLNRLCLTRARLENGSNVNINVPAHIA